MNKISILIPVYNEVATLETILTSYENNLAVIHEGLEAYVE